MSTVAICGDGGFGLSASGTTQSDAYQLNRVYNDVTTVASGSGVKLPITEEGEVIYITNSGANALKVYPYESTTTVDDGSSLTVNTHCSALLYAVSRTAWKALQGFNSAVPILHYGSFYDTTTQSQTTANTAKTMTFNTSASENGVTRGTPTSRIVVANSGIYNIQFSAQVEQSSGATEHIYIWLRLNGSNVAQTAGVVSIQGSSAQVLPAWNYVLQLAANDYIELVWSTTNTNAKLLAAAASSPVPAIPSVILTVTQVNNI
jgi:hypothetical protein